MPAAETAEPPRTAGDFDAVLLAGGRASRLGGIDKPALQVGGRSLLAAAVDAVRDARSIVVVGPDRDDDGGVAATARARIRMARECPPFGGPVAALAAGLDALGAAATPSVVVLAADQPNAHAAIGRLLAHDGPDGVLAVDPSGRRQYLLARYGTAALRDRLNRLRAEGPLDGRSLRQLVDALDLAEVVLSEEVCSDVDTEEDARRFGIRLPNSESEGTV